MEHVGNVLESNVQLQRLWERDSKVLSREILEEMAEVIPSSFLSDFARDEIRRRNDAK